MCVSSGMCFTYLQLTSRDLDLILGRCFSCCSYVIWNATNTGQWFRICQTHASCCDCPYHKVVLFPAYLELFLAFDSNAVAKRVEWNEPTLFATIFLTHYWPRSCNPRVTGLMFFTRRKASEECIPSSLLGMNVRMKLTSTCQSPNPGNGKQRRPWSFHFHHLLTGPVGI